MFLGQFSGFDIYLSDRPEKKYYTIVGNKKVYFGSSRHQHFYDRIGYYTSLNHNDVIRRRRYYERHKINYPRGSPDWLSKTFLW